MRKAIAFCFGVTIAVSFFFLGSIKSGLAFDSFEYPQIQNGTMIYDYDVSTGAYLEFFPTASTTVNSITLYIAGTCTNNGTTPNVELRDTGVVKTTSPATDITVDSKTAVTFSFTPYEIGPGKTLGFKLNVGVCSQKPRFYGIATNPYSTTTEARFRDQGGSHINAGLPGYIIDIAEQDPPGSVEIIEIDETPEYVEIMLDESFEFNSKNCIIGEDCEVKLYYGTEYDNGIFYLVNDAEGERSREQAISSTSVGVKLVRSEWFDIPARATAGTDSYCFFGETASSSLELKCGLDITWLDEEGLDTAAFQECISTACDDVATTSAWWDVDFQGAIECGTRKTVCWLFTPSTSAKNKFQNTNEELKENFPLSVGYQVKEVWSLAGLQTASSATIALAPLKWWDPDTGTWKETGSNLLDNKTLENGMGADLYDTYYTWFERIIWLVFFVFLMNRVILLVNPDSRSLFDIRPKKIKHEIKETEYGTIKSMPKRFRV